jgi:PAS domain S-box-containing protein
VTASVSDLGLAAVLKATAQPIWVVDPDGLIRFANPAAVATLGYGRAEELVGRPSHETIHHHRPDGRPYPASECPMLLPRSSGETVSRDPDWFFRRDGTMVRVSRLAGQQADEVFAAVAREVGSVLRLALVQLSRSEGDGTATVLAAWSESPHPFRAGTRWPLDGPSITATLDAAPA